MSVPHAADALPPGETAAGGSRGRGRHTLTRRVLLSSTALGLLLLAITAVFVLATEAQRDAARQRRDALTRTAALARTEKLLIDAETGERGYVISGDPSFLEPWQLARASFPDQAAQIVRRQPDAISRRLAETVRADGLAYIEGFTRRLIGLVARGRRETAIRIVGSEAGKRRLDALRRRLGQLMALESRRVAAFDRRADAAATRATVAGLGGAVGIVLLLAGFATYIARSVSAPIRRVAAAADQLPSHPAGRVPAEGADELQRLARSFNAMAAAVQQNAAALERRNAQLDAARRDAEQANEAKSEFLSRMSHELRTPLNAILGFAQVLETTGLDDQQREDLRQIVVAGRHLLELINEVLDITRIERGGIAPSSELVDLGQSIDAVTALTGPLAAAKGIALERADGDDPPYRAIADPRHVKQILLNLVSNAIKYNRDGGSVRISVQHDAPGHVRVVVADDGPGVRPEDHERMFQPFHRLGAEQGTTEGTGLGLPVSRQLAEDMAGTLTVTSALGAGSAFALRLPAG